MAHLFGLSTQPRDEQAEAAARLHLPFDLLSDAELNFAQSLGLPVFEAAGRILLKRLTLIARNGRVEAVFYPVFPPNEAPQHVIHGLQARD